MNLMNRVEEVVALLQKVSSDYESVVFANSLGAEDMVLTDLIVKSAPAIRSITLDTGRLHEETYQLMDIVRKHYGITIDVYYPDTARIETWSRLQGMNAFYRNIEMRKACCEIRKVEPLQRALHGQQAWITGIRQQQAPGRAKLTLKEWDHKFGLQKINPLIEWTQEDVWNYIHQYHVPYNALHDKAFTSIGCAPCTRPVQAGEDIRAGRWWWEQQKSKECGLHSA